IQARAESALEALKQTLALKRSASGSESSEYLMVDQSALTGESLPVHRNKGDVVYSSSIVKQQMLAIVVKTGKDTYIGRAAALMNMAAVKFRNTSSGRFTNCSFRNYGRQLAAKKVIIRCLAAIEELASASILCSDKTGTLTLNELSTDDSWLAPSYTESDLFLHAYVCSDPGTDDTIELAVRDAAEKKLDILKNRENEHEVPGFKVKSFVPFNPSKKLSQVTAIDLETQKEIQIAKGAPQVIVQLAGGISSNLA
ncbi:19451_t:CDS:2, partial [Racocetra persica]